MTSPRQADRIGRLPKLKPEVELDANANRLKEDFSILDPGISTAWTCQRLEPSPPALGFAKKNSTLNDFPSPHDTRMWHSEDSVESLIGVQDPERAHACFMLQPVSYDPSDV